MHVIALSREDRTRRLKSSIDKGDRVRLHPQVAGAVLVSSASRPGLWHYATEAFCDCISYQQRGICRHMVRASWELHQAKKGAASAATDLPPAA
jgi:hypothetical protein